MWTRLLRRIFELAFVWQLIVLPYGSAAAGDELDSLTAGIKEVHVELADSYSSADAPRVGGDLLGVAKTLFRTALIAPASGPEVPRADLNFFEPWSGNPRLILQYRVLVTRLSAGPGEDVFVVTCFLRITRTDFAYPLGVTHFTVLWPQSTLLEKAGDQDALDSETTRTITSMMQEMQTEVVARLRSN